MIHLAFSIFWQQLDPTQPGPVPGPILGDTWTLFMMVVKMCISLGLVCILAYFTLRFGLPRLAGAQTAQGQIMRVVARYPLDTQKSLYIVAVPGKHLLLGVSNERVEMISELETEAVQAALTAAEVEAVARPNFGSNAIKEFSKYLRR